ncbi:quinic acid utilization activator [Aspergillus unguis]
MSSDTRQPTIGSAKSKRRATDAGDEDNNNTGAGNGVSSRAPGEDTASNPKRQRVSRACDSCRSKKDKCDGAQPICSTCASLSRPCTYRANPKKRGLPTGYIRTLELMWGLVFTKIQGSQEVVKALLRAANIPSHLATVGKEAEGSDTLMASWKNSAVLKEIERLLTVLEQPDDEARSVMESPADVDGSSILSPEALEWHLPGPPEDSVASGPSPVRAPFRPATRTTRDSGTQTASDFREEPPVEGQRYHRADDLTPTFERVQLPPNPWPLFDIYFSYTQCWLPILEKHDILRTAFRHANDDQNDSTSASGDQAALWAVLAFASIQQASISATRQLDVSDDQPNPKQLYAKARSLIPPESGSYQTGHVQALLILSLIKLGQQNWGSAWMLIGQAVRIAQSLGLNSPPTTSANDDKTAGRSKHVFLGCFVLETLVAAQLGQVPSLRKSDLTKVGLINEDGLEEWHPWEDQTGLRPVESPRGSFHRGPLHALSTFNRLVSLMAILNDLCCLGQSSTVSYLEALERQLQIWVSALPKTYRIDLQTISSKPASPHIFGLEMMYEAVAAALSVQLGVQKNEGGGLRRASEASKRLISLLQAYMDTYSLSATCPTFGLALMLSLPSAEALKNAPRLGEADSGIKHKLRSFSSHLTTVWNYSGGALVKQRDTSNTSPATQNAPGRVSNLIDDSRPVSLATPDTYLSPTWMGTSLNADAVLSLPTPTSSLNIPPAIETNSTQHIPHRSSVSGRPSAPILSDITTPFPAAPQYQQGYNDTSPNYQSLVDMDGSGSLQRPRIAPDLDALFDELASLDGTDRMDNQPEFMQNLGFVPEAGIPELYPYTSQRDPFLLASTQQLPSENSIRREAQITGELNPR